MLWEIVLCAVVLFLAYGALVHRVWNRQAGIASRVAVGSYFQDMGEGDIAARRAWLTTDTEPTRAALQEAYTAAVLNKVHVPLPWLMRVDELRSALRSLLHNTGWLRALQVPYSIAFIASDTFEDGYPHTHGQSICLPPGFFSLPHGLQLKTFVHEFVHVYQRAKSDDVDALLTEWGYKRLLKRSELRRLGYELRSNPDLDDWAWQRNGAVGFMVFRAHAPRRLSDADLVCLDATSLLPCKSGAYTADMPASATQAEHPYEVMACVLAHIIVGEGGQHPMETVARQYLFR